LSYIDFDLSTNW